MLAASPVALGCLVLLASLQQTVSQHLADTGSYEHRQQRLAILLPTSNHGRNGGQWPITRCPPGKMTLKVDLVLYVPLQEGVLGMRAQPPSPRQGHCFARVRTVYGSETDPAQSNNPASDMLYSAFLDEDPRAQLSGYAALAVVPSWGDADTATDLSLDLLYDLAFPEHAPEDDKFWVKTLTLEGEPKNLRRGDGQSSGGGGVSIYNNDDPEFADFVRSAQRQRWEASASGSFDEALSLTLEDRRYGGRVSKFVTAGMASTTISGGDVDEENYPFPATTTRKLTGEVPKWKLNEKYKNLAKWKGDVDNGIEPKWKGDPDNGVLPNWQVEEKWTTKFCADGCKRTSNDGTKGRVCDPSCDDGEPYGKKGCSAKNGQYGMYCRVCYNSMSKAHDADSVGDRAIMCDTMQPPSAEAPFEFGARSLAAGEEHPDESASGMKRRLQHFKEHHETTRKLSPRVQNPLKAAASSGGTTRKLSGEVPKWKQDARYKNLAKWKGDVDNGVEPKWKGDPDNGVLPNWQAEEKWTTKFCADGCKRTSNDGTKGRVCDPSCDDGEPYGKKGCSAKNGQYGMYCRVCYNSMSKAHDADSVGDRAIMCDTMAPPAAESPFEFRARSLAGGEEYPDYHSEAVSELAAKLLVFERD